MSDVKTNNPGEEKDEKIDSQINQEWI